jgi:hypothetical protein
MPSMVYVDEALCDVTNRDCIVLRTLICYANTRKVLCISVVIGVVFVEINFWLNLVIDRWVADDKIKEYMMGAACSTCGGRREMRASFWWESPNDKD